jgi:ABC-type transport system involved in multi-copper enzyme maturation permease subunit
MGILQITRFTLQEAFHRWLLFAMLLLNILLLGVFALLVNSAYTSIITNPSNQDDLQYSLLRFAISIILSVWAVYLLSGALTIILTVGMTSGEIEAGTFAMIVSKPLRRLDIILGKWLGYALILTVYTAMLFFTFLGIIYLRTSYFPQQSFQALGLLELSSLVLLALTTLGSACLPTLVNGAIVIMLFIIAPLASFVELISIKPGSVAQNTTTIINLIIPTDALWHGASFYLIPPSVFQLVQGIAVEDFKSPFTSIQPIAPALLVWSVCYCIVLPLLGVWRFQRRDL